METIRFCIVKFIATGMNQAIFFAYRKIKHHHITDLRSEISTKSSCVRCISSDTNTSTLRLTLMFSLNDNGNHHSCQLHELVNHSLTLEHNMLLPSTNKMMTHSSPML
jgi:hypothetical protein